MSTATKGPKLSRQTTANEVARLIREGILLGRYPAGEFLRQEAIAEQLGVSRIPVREAIAQLEGEGFVAREKYRGALVSTLSVAEIREIYDLRAMLEPHLLRASAPKLTAPMFKKLYANIEKSSKSKDIDYWSKLNISFHQMLYAPSELPLTIQVLDNLMMRAGRYFKMQQSLSVESRAESDEEHRSILDLCVERRFDEAVDTLQRHIMWNAADVIRSVNRALEAISKPE